MAPRRRPSPEARPQEVLPVTDVRIPPSGDPFTSAPHHDQVGHPCCCNGGWVSIGQILIDPETGEEVEEHALYLCRRCADSR